MGSEMCIRDRLEAAGVRAILVGESLLSSPDPSDAAAALLGNLSS